MRWARYRKTLAVVLLGVVELAAYVAADPRDLPSWVVTGALAVNALAVYVVRNQPPPTVAPTLFARRPAKATDPRSTLPRTSNSATEADPPRRDNPGTRR